MISLDSASDRRSFMIPQESHADLAAQFAAQWGNEMFARLAPYDTMVFAAVYHDSQYRELEADLPIDLEQGRPHGHRTTPYSAKKIPSLYRNIEWVGAHDPYAGLIVSMHHTGLAQNRNGVINSWQSKVGAKTPKRPMQPEVAAMVAEMESRQHATIARLAEHDPSARDQISTNYRLFQVFDLLSLYFCCDGHAEDGMKEATIGPVPVSYSGRAEVDLHLIPTGGGTVRLDPYPFDRSPLTVSVAGRTVERASGRSEEDCKAAYYIAPRETRSWILTR
jgi:hypothetical protein